MKTTIEISDDLTRRTRAYAASKRTTLRALVERALRELLRAEQQRPAFTLRDASVDGRGLQSEYRDADWQRLRQAAYEGRGA
ncbi:MAG: type II toxin-antitoxin system VapB family antitoxin [Halieaceae bacterium]|nr:type II toxin-antitoxin system VapB family antitoxin [Halieaceae bacterium]